MYMPVSVYMLKSRNLLAAWSTYGCLLVRGDDVDKGGSHGPAEYEYAASFKYGQLSSFWALNGTWQNYYNVLVGKFGIEFFR